jgi:HSP20 family protein
MIRKTLGHALNQDAADLAEDARRLLTELDRDVPGAAQLSAECRPPLDVLETATALEIVVDVPGVPTQSLRVAIRRSTLLVVGAKLALEHDGTTRYHLAERGYGRFARAVRLTGAVDATRARATTSAGELRIILPRLEERRGSVFTIPVERA